MELTTWTVPWRPNMVSWVRLRWLLLPISSFRDLAQNLTTTVSTILTLRYFEYPFSLPHVPSVFSLSHSVNLHAAARRVRWFRRAEASWAKGWGGSRVATGRDHPPTTEAVWCQRTKVRGVSSGGDGFQCLSADTVCICCFFLGSRVLDQPAQMKIWQEPSLWSMASRDLEWIKWVTLLNSSSNLSLFFGGLFRQKCPDRWSRPCYLVRARSRSVHMVKVTNTLKIGFNCYICDNLCILYACRIFNLIWLFTFFIVMFQLSINQYITYCNVIVEFITGTLNLNGLQVQLLHCKFCFKQLLMDWPQVGEHILLVYFLICDFITIIDI